MKDVMLDLETMGQRTNSAIIAIGAVAFDKTGLGERIYIPVDLQSCVDWELVIDPKTIMWWMKQSDAARKKIYGEDGVYITEALKQFSQFVKSVAGDSEPEVWGNGASFDNAILSNAYAQCRQEQPWKYWNDRCYRTFKAKSKVTHERTGTHHNALDDAVYQAEHLRKILGWVK